MLSIIVLSSDGYSDCWIPFFKLFRKNFPDLDKYEIILSTNTKTFEYSGLKIKTITHGEKTAWSKRLKVCLKKAKNDIVLVMAEDLFLRSLIDVKKLNDFLVLMKGADDIDHIRLLSTRDRTKVKGSAYDDLDEIEQKTKLRFLYLPGLWKKNILLKYLVNYESPFMSEKLGDARSWIYKHRFYAVSSKRRDNDEQFYDCRPSGALFKGKWSNWVPALLKEYDVHIDFDKRGFETKEFAKTSRIKSKIELLKTPISTFRSFLNIIILYIKVKIFKVY